jgi:hypothetical protein
MPPHLFPLLVSSAGLLLLLLLLPLVKSDVSEDFVTDVLEAFAGRRCTVFLIGDEAVVNRHEAIEVGGLLFACVLCSGTWPLARSVVKLFVYACQSAVDFLAMTSQ